jgi:hypothetical protein
MAVAGRSRPVPTSRMLPKRLPVSSKSSRWESVMPAMRNRSPTSSACTYCRSLAIPCLSTLRLAKCRSIGRTDKVNGTTKIPTTIQPRSRMVAAAEVDVSWDGASRRLLPLIKDAAPATIAPIANVSIAPVGLIGTSAPTVSGARAVPNRPIPPAQPTPVARADAG